VQYVDRKTGFSVIGQTAGAEVAARQHHAADETNAVLLQGITEGRMLVEP